MNSSVRKLKLKSVFTMLGVVSLILIGGLIVSANALFVTLLIIWSFMLIYTLDRLSQNIVMCFFLIAFFVFLMGREVVYEFGGGKRLYSFLDITNNETFLLLNLSLLGVWGGSLYIKYLEKAKNKKINKIIACTNKKAYKKTGYQIVCEMMYYICYVAAVIAIIYKIRFVHNVGYLASYTSEAGGAGVPSIIAYLGNFLPVILSMYLATCPVKRKVIFPTILYEVYAFLTLLTGQRYPFIGISLYILTYWFLREKLEGGWIKKRYYFMLILMIPVLLLGITAYDSIRVGQNADFNSISEGIRNFFVDQGGSINVIRRTIYNAEQLKDIKWVSFDTTFSTIKGNIFVRKLFNTNVYYGNSMEHAMLGHSLAHRLSYYAYGTGYLAGRGTGTSYIAELFHDFSYIGVVIGSFLYGLLIEKINRIEFKSYIESGFLLAISYYIYLLPRGNFDGFIGGIFNIYAILLWLVTYVLLQIINRNRKKR